MEELMANWITHSILADHLLEFVPGLDARGFAVGNIGPDRNIENETWTAFTPPREVTHFMRGQKKTTADTEAFFARYIAGRRFSTSEERSFLLGYYARLHTDVLFTRFIHDEERLRACFARIRAEESYARAVRGLPETWDALKLAFSRQELGRDIVCFEHAYLQAHPQGCYALLCATTSFQDYLDLLPPGAIARKIGVMCRRQEIVPNSPQILFTQTEYNGFVDAACQKIAPLLCAE